LGISARVKNTINDNNFCSNVFENLQAIRGETVKGVLMIPGKPGSNWLIIFESGYSLEVHTETCVFWINNKEKTKCLISEEASRRSALLENLEEVKKIL